MAENEPECRVDDGHVHHGRCRVERGGAFGRDDDRHGLVGAVDRHLLRHVGGGALAEPGGADEDHRFAREVDVLLVLRDVAADGLVAELRQLDANLVRRDGVRTVADDGPVTARRCEARRDGTDLGAHRENPLHGVRHVNERTEHAVDAPDRRVGELQRDGARQDGARGNLCVERLRAGNAHLDVTTVRRVVHAVRLVCEITGTTVHDGQDRRTATGNEVHRAVGVRGGAALADGDDQHVRHVGFHGETGQLGGGEGENVHVVGQEFVQHRDDGRAGNRRRPLTDHTDAADRTIGQPLAHRRRQRRLVEFGNVHPVHLADTTAQGLAETAR